VSDGSTLRSNIEGVETKDSFVVTMWNCTSASNGYRPCRSPAFMVRKGDWKLIVSGQTDNKNVDMLFNLKEDPAEINNLIGKNGNMVPDTTISKAEHLKATLVKYLQDSDHPAAGAVQDRQTWRETAFWADSSLKFRDTLADGTRIEWIYIGSPSGEIVNVSVEGDIANCYGLWLDSQYGQNGKGFSVVAVRYQASDLVGAQIPVNLVIKLGGGDERKVLLIPPHNNKIMGTPGTISTINFLASIQFSLDLTNSPTTITIMSQNPKDEENKNGRYGPESAVELQATTAVEGLGGSSASRPSLDSATEQRTNKAGWSPLGAIIGLMMAIVAFVIAFVLVRKRTKQSYPPPLEPGHENTNIEMYTICHNDDESSYSFGRTSLSNDLSPFLQSSAEAKIVGY